jgi:hypothetical protein
VISVKVDLGFWTMVQLFITAQLDPGLERPAGEPGRSR